MTSKTLAILCWPSAASSSAFIFLTPPEARPFLNAVRCDSPPVDESVAYDDAFASVDACWAISPRFSKMRGTVLKSSANPAKKKYVAQANGKW